MSRDEELAIKVRGLRKLYRGEVTIPSLDLDVRRGEVFALLGPNGAGKTTTVEILEGFRSRDGGTVEVLGVDPRDGDENWKARIGLVLQSTSEFEDLNVGEVLHHFARFYPNPRDPEELLDTLGLAPMKKKRVSKLSGGQQRKLDVALAIVGQPELVFLDEPTTGFDSRSRRDFWYFIKDLANRGTTMLLTTHYLEEAEFLADRAGVLVHGEIVDVATPATLGGRDTEQAIVSWTAEDGNTERIHTASPSEVVVDLVRRFGGEVPGLVVARPTLDDIYLQMIAASDERDAQARERAELEEIAAAGAREERQLEGAVR